MNHIPMTLIFLVRDGEILLAQKKRGFGKDNWNGAGGKLEPGETIEQALVRECQEEICVTPQVFEQAALLTFDVHYNGKHSVLEMHGFLCTKWEGEPTETEEMQPKWFKTKAIPYDEMWSDDRFWLPQVLDGKKVVGTFSFDKDDKMLDQKVYEVSAFDT